MLPNVRSTLLRNRSFCNALFSSLDFECYLYLFPNTFYDSRNDIVKVKKQKSVFIINYRVFVNQKPRGKFLESYSKFNFFGKASIIINAHCCQFYWSVCPHLTATSSAVKIRPLLAATVTEICPYLLLAVQGINFNRLYTSKFYTLDFKKYCTSECFIHKNLNKTS